MAEMMERDRGFALGDHWSLGSSERASTPERFKVHVLAVLFLIEYMLMIPSVVGVVVWGGRGGVIWLLSELLRFDTNLHV